MTRVPLRDAPSGAHADEAPPLAGAAGLRLAHPHDPAMRQVMATLLRCEAAAQILLWCHADTGQLAQIELPRLRLNFVARPAPAAAATAAADGEGGGKGGGEGGGEGVRLYCEEEPGFWLARGPRDPAVDELLLGLPMALLLQNAQAEFLVLLPAAGRPMPSADGVWLRHGEPEWVAALGDVRHYAYPVHACGVFLSSRTLASSLYLLAVRLLGRRYEMAFRLAESCITDATLSAEEAQLWELLALAGADTHPDAHAVRRNLALALLPISSRISPYLPTSPHISPHLPGQVRLKLALVLLGSEPDIMAVPWDVAAELEAYALKAAFVSPACRLGLDEELLLLSQVRVRAGARARVRARVRARLT